MNKKVISILSLGVTSTIPIVSYDDTIILDVNNSISYNDDIITVENIYIQSYNDEYYYFIDYDKNIDLIGLETDNDYLKLNKTNKDDLYYLEFDDLNDIDNLYVKNFIDNNNQKIEFDNRFIYLEHSLIPKNERFYELNKKIIDELNDNSNLFEKYIINVKNRERDVIYEK